jgi:hypothetical protein
MAKQVRHSFGAAGLIPAALLMPGTTLAHAAPVKASAPAKSVKTVGYMRSATADAFASSSSRSSNPPATSSPSADSPAAGTCSGTTFVRNPATGSHYLGLWHEEFDNQSQCIGTVKKDRPGSLFNLSEFWRIRVWNPPGKNQKLRLQAFDSADASSIPTIAFLGIHRKFKGNPNACSAIGWSDGTPPPIWSTGYCVTAK